MKKINKSLTARLQLIGSMTVFGTVGIFVRYIPLPSAFIAFVRGAVGVLFLLAVCLFTRKKLSGESIRRNLALLLISGAAIGVNWIFLFEAYRYTTVATATLCYYTAPLFVLAVSPIFLGERLTVRKCAGIGTALVGMVFVSGVHKTGFSGIAEARGIILGVLAAIFYASVIVMNKKLGDVGSYDRTIVQLSAAAAIVLPYSLIAEDVSLAVFDAKVIVLLAVVGIVHTGISYAMYFSSLGVLKAQTVALFSYIDPIIAIVLSAVVLREGMDLLGVIGAILVLSSVAIAGE